MRIGLASVVLFGFLSAVALADADGPIVDKATGLAFPAQIGNFQRTTSKVFPDARNGIVIRYEGPGQAQVFVYDMGFGEIPTGADSEVVSKAFTQSEMDLERLLAVPPASDAKKFAESIPVIESEGRVAKARVGLYAWTFTEADGTKKPMASWVVVTGFKNKLLKLLYTSPAPDPMSAQQEVKDLIARFLDANPNERENFLVDKKAP